MPILSIVVPVYNSERSIKKCVDSILSQTLIDFEIILVDDGSIDTCAEICDDYALQDSRVKVVHIDNGGVSHARNVGIRETTGKYIQFVDSDDYIDKNMSEYLVNIMVKDNVDLVICGYKTVRSSKVVKQCGVNKEYDELSILSTEFASLYKIGFLNPPWNKIFKREKLNNLFDEDMELGEDLIFNVYYMQNVKKLIFIKEPFYNYVLVGSQSLTQKYYDNGFETVVKKYQILNKFIKGYLKHNVDKGLIDDVFCYDVLLNFRKLVASKYDIKHTLELLKKWSQYFDENYFISPKSFRYKIFWYIINNEKVFTLLVYLKIRMSIKRLFKNITNTIAY